MSHLRALVNAYLLLGPATSFMPSSDVGMFSIAYKRYGIGGSVDPCKLTELVHGDILRSQTG